MKSTVSATAQTPGIYHCVGDGQTLYREIGDEFPLCSCGVKTWELLVEDNFPDNELIPLFVGNDTMCFTLTNQLPELGTEYNLRGGGYYGKYQITDMREIQREDKLYFNVLVAKVGELDPTLVIHSLTKTSY